MQPYHQEKPTGANMESGGFARFSKAAVIGLLTIATVALSSCGTSATGPSSETPAASKISHAITAAISAGTADVGAVVTSTTVGGSSAPAPAPAGQLSPPVEYKGHGVVDFARSMAELTVSGGPSGSKAGCNNSFVVLTTGSALYVACAHPPASAGPLAAEWFCVPLTGSSAPTNGLYFNFHSLFDPSIWLGAVRASESTASSAGQSLINATRLARYNLVLRSFAPPAPPAAAQTSKRTTAQASNAAGASGAKPVPGSRSNGTSPRSSASHNNSDTATVWLSAGDRLDMLRVKVTMASPAGSTGTSGALQAKDVTYDITFTFSHFGEPPSLVTPSSLIVLDPKGC